MEGKGFSMWRTALGSNLWDRNDERLKKIQAIAVATSV